MCDSRYACSESSVLPSSEIGIGVELSSSVEVADTASTWSLFLHEPHARRQGDMYVEEVKAYSTTAQLHLLHNLSNSTNSVEHQSLGISHWLSPSTTCFRQNNTST